MAPSQEIADAEAELAKAEADLANAEAAPADEVSTEELLAKAPPLVLPGGSTLHRQCPVCGLNFAPDPGVDLAGMPCPNCHTPLP